MNHTYPSNLSDAEWECLQHLLPARTPRGRLRRHRLRSVFDALFYLLRTGCPWRYLPSIFRTNLDTKAVCAGRQVHVVPPAYTSQDCGGCGQRVHKTLSVRTHLCLSCGLVLDRNENAALNNLRAGQAHQALTRASGSSVA